MAKKALQTSLGTVSLLRTRAERYLNLFGELRPWWPVLVPFLLWRGKKAYDKEFRHMLDEVKVEAKVLQAAAKQNEAKQAKAQAKILQAEAKQADKQAKRLHTEAKLLETAQKKKPQQ